MESTSRVQVLSPLKAIRRNCVDCMGGSYKLVENCETRECPCWPYRFGLGRRAALNQGRDVTP